MRPLSEDLRARVVAAIAAGQTPSEVYRRFGVSRSSVYRYCTAHARHGHCRPKQIGGHRRSRLQKHEKKLRRWLARQPDLTLAELQARCQSELQVQIRTTALWHQLDRWGLSFKKNDARRRASAARREKTAPALAAKPAPAR
jgi:transposase